MEYCKNVLGTYSSVFQIKQQRILVDFVFLLFFNHFHLYKYVFTRDRDVDRTEHSLIMEMPSVIPRLCEGMEKTKYDKQQALVKLEDKHQRRQMVCLESYIRISKNMHFFAVVILCT